MGAMEETAPSTIATWINFSSMSSDISETQEHQVSDCTDVKSGTKKSTIFYRRGTCRGRRKAPGVRGTFCVQFVGWATQGRALSERTSLHEWIRCSLLGPLSQTHSLDTTRLWEVWVREGVDGDLVFQCPHL